MPKKKKKLILPPLATTKAQLTSIWHSCAASGTFLTRKHDLNRPASWGNYSTVLSSTLSASLDSFIDSGSYSVDEYSNSDYNNYFYVVTPYTSSVFATIPVGFPTISGSLDLSQPVDRLIIFSGSSQGWHCAAESSSRITERIISGSLTYLRNII